jgi:hypothetical protein
VARRVPGCVAAVSSRGLLGLPAEDMGYWDNLCKLVGPVASLIFSPNLDTGQERASDGLNGYIGPISSKRCL